MSNSRVYDPEEHYSSSIYYHENGTVKAMQHSKNLKDVGHYQEYDANGKPTKSWDYDENGKQINVYIPKR